MPSKSRFKAKVGGITPLKIPDPQPVPQQVQPDIDLPDIAKINIGDKTFNCSVDDLEVEYELGRGAYGHVSCMKHKPTDTLMAVKRIRATLNQAENKRLLMDCNVAMKSVDCPYTITFYGALFREGDVWICMELMDTSLDKLCNSVYKRLHEIIPELIVGKMAESTLKALKYLHDELNVMHRDVKPSNILINREGQIKLCDFGIAGELVNSLAKTDIGCRPYLAPERIYYSGGGPLRYDHRCDVWSLGITIYELAVGEFPYPPYRNLFEQMKLVIEGDPPRLAQDRGFPQDLQDFVAGCLTKERDDRPRYEQLIGYDLIRRIEAQEVGVASWYADIRTKEEALPKEDDKPPQSY